MSAFRSRSLAPTVSTVTGWKVLIDWELAAAGIWTITPPEEAIAPAPGGEWRPFVGPRDRRRAWRGLLLDDLLDALQAWNDQGDLVMGRSAHQYTDEDRAAFWARGRELAEEVQRQLGPDYEVLFVTGSGAWQWVEPPARRNDRQM